MVFGDHDHLVGVATLPDNSDGPTPLESGKPAIIMMTPGMPVSYTHLTLPTKA